MMEEVTQLMALYGHPNSEAIFHLFATNREINKAKAFDYLMKYYISKKDYFKIWKPIQNSIFRDEIVLEKLFHKKYSLNIESGGVLFEENDFKVLQEYILELGDQYIIIIQNDFMGQVKLPIFRMIYPSNISWQEINNGSFISVTLLEMPFNEYFVFSESKLWGMYIANDNDPPLNIMGILEK